MPGRPACLLGALTCLLALGLAPAAEAIEYPLRWRWSNPTPHGGNVYDMAYSFNYLLAVQVAERGQIYTSEDLDVWTLRSSGTTNALRGVAFFGARIVVVGERGTVLYADAPDAFTNGTLLDGPTTNWLEAVAASSTLCVAAGDNGSIYTSRDGVTWKKQTSGTTTWLRGVAWGGSGFVAVGESGFVARSLNGTNWTSYPSGTAVDLNRVYFTPPGRYVAVGAGGVSLYSTNGILWQPEVSGATNDLQNAATGDGSRLLAGVHEVRLHDGLGWSNELTKATGPPDWTYYATFGRPDFYVIAGQTGMVAEGYKTNTPSYFWIPTAESVRNWLWDVVYLNNLYVAVGDFATVMTSGNGVNWKLEVVPDAVTNSIFLGLGGTTNLLVAVGDQGSMAVSPNVVTNVVVTTLVGTNLVVTTNTVNLFGVVWHPARRMTTNDLQGVGWHNGLYLATGDQGTVLVSADGTNWNARPAVTTKLLSSVASWPGGVVATGDDGAVLTSPDGWDWTARTPFTTNWLYRVRYLGGHLIAVGQNGALFTSTNATNWTSRDSGTTKWLNDVAKVDDTWFVVGAGGTVLTSTNLTHWTHVGTLTKKALYGLATDSRQLIAVGVEGIILRCAVLPDLTPIRILGYDRVKNLALQTAQNIFLFGGKTDQRFTLDYRAGLGTNQWSTGAQLEIFDTSGTLYYLETIFSTNLPPSELYRATLGE